MQDRWPYSALHHGGWKDWTAGVTQRPGLESCAGFSLWDSAPGGSVTRGHQEDHMAGDKASDLRNHSITPSPRCCKAQGGTQSPLGGECPGHCAEGDVGWERPLSLSLRLSLENMASLPRCV